MRANSIQLAGLVLVYACLAACGVEQPAATGPVTRPVKIFVVDGTAKGAVRTFPGRVDAAQTAELAFRVSGQLQDILVREGDMVEAGQVLARLDPTDFRIVLEDRQASFDNARSNFERARELGMPAASIPGAYIILMLRFGEYDNAKQVLNGYQRMLGLAPYWLDAFLMALEDPELLPAAVAAVEKAAENGDVPRLHLYPLWTYLQQDDRALDVAFGLYKDRPNFNTEFLFSRESAVLRANPRFEQLIRTIGLSQYWEEFGWPDTCQPAGESFVCK